MYGTWLCLGLLPCASATGSDSESVQLSIPDCAEASGKQIAQLVALELASRENLRLQDSGKGLQASLRCTGDSAVITVRDPLRPVPLLLEMQLAQTQREARPRLLALAIAELIATSRLEQVQSPLSPTPRAAESELSLWLAAGLLRAYQPGLWAGAAAAGAAYSFGPIALGGELGFDGTSHQTVAVGVRTRALSVALTPSLLLLREPLEWTASVGARVGYVWMDGHARSLGFGAGSVSGAFVSPLVASALRWPIDDHWAVRLSLEFGYVIAPVRGLDADRATLLELKGVRAAALLGMGWAF